MTKLTLDDIVDARAYEREREEFRERVMALKRRRRIGIGPLVTVVFENRDTVRFQIQEMARAERMLSDAAIQGELDVYNPLVPEPGQLSATLFLELTSPAALREWLPKLVGIERAVAIRIGDAVIPARPEDAHVQQLTREEITSAVHYVQWSMTAPERRDFGTAPLVAVRIDHPSYRHETALGEATRAELLRDLGGGA
ncbi:MAG TPA: DUF3501 family protein [Acidimicrobiales bacterium]|nr:DUF3501 family protein [Acidimicrobiales bacterium]